MSKKETLEFEDLTKYQLSMIKTRAVSIFTDTKVTDGAIATVQSTFEMINALGYKIVKDATKPENEYKEPVKVKEDPKQKSGYWWTK